MLSDKKQHLPSPKRRHGPRTRYPDSVKLEVVKLWLITGNLVQTAAAMNVDVNTVKKWRACRWWDELVADIRSENQIGLSNKLRKIVEKSHSLILDRLDNGDYIYDQKKGQLIRKPLVARDINIIAKDSLDRHLLLERKPLEQEQQQQISDRLAQLGEAFAKLANQKKTINVTDVIYVEEAVGSRKEETQEPGEEDFEEFTGNMGSV